MGKEDKCIHVYCFSAISRFYSICERYTLQCTLCRQWKLADGRTPIMKHLTVGTQSRVVTEKALFHNQSLIFPLLTSVPSEEKQNICLNVSNTKLAETNFDVRSLCSRKRFAKNVTPFWKIIAMNVSLRCLALFAVRGQCL